MLSRSECDRVAQAVRSASASIETQFVDMGSRLASAVDTIGTLTQTFDRLADELRSDNLSSAAHELSQIMSRVTALAGVQDDARPVFEQLAELTSRIQRRVAQMGKAVAGIGMIRRDVTLRG
jgi:hypothetical protein